MNQNFSKTKILHESSKLEHFSGGGGENFGSTNLGEVKILDLSKVLVSSSYHICNILDWG